MPSKELIEKFERENGVTLNRQSIQNVMERIFTNDVDNGEREVKIAENVKLWYTRISAEYERNKVNASVRNINSITKKTPFEFFEEYMGIVSEIAKETSEQMVTRSKEDAETAKLNVEKAKAALEEAQKNLVEKPAIARQEAENGTIKKENIEYIENTYKVRLQDAEIALKNAQAKQEAYVGFDPYEPTMDYFGLSEADAKGLIEAQVKGCTYMEARRDQIKSVGVTSPVFMKELRETGDKNISYETASDEDKRRIQEIYATRQIMQEKLESKTGFIGWLWKIVHFVKTGAMTSYITSANSLLFTAGFNEAKDAEEAADAMSQKGYSYSEYKASENAIKDKFARNETTYASIKAKEDERIAEENARKAEIEAKIKAVQQKPFKDQLFEIAFRPSKDKETFNAQLNEYKEVASFVKNNKIPDDVRAVLKANGQKIAASKKHFYSQETKEKQCEEIEAALAGEISVDNYKPMTYEEVKASATAKEPLTVNLDDPNAKLEVSQPIEEPSKQKELTAQIN